MRKITQTPISLRNTKTPEGVLALDFLHQLQLLFGLDVFIEAGTYLGETTKIASQVFPHIDTIEVSEELHQRAKQRFSNSSNIEFFQGDASKVLSTLLGKVQGKGLLWLDAHYREGIAPQEKNHRPIIDELAAVKFSGLTDLVILIDDLRMFQPVNRRLTADSSLVEYPTLMEIYEAVLDISPDYNFYVFGDVALAFCQGTGVEVSPVISACTISRLYNEEHFTIEDLLKAEQIIASSENEEKRELVQLSQRFTANELLGLGQHYSLWKGLIDSYCGQHQEACLAFQRSIELGINHWRVYHYLSQSALVWGDDELASRAAKIVEMKLPETIQTEEEGAVTDVFFDKDKPLSPDVRLQSFNDVPNDYNNSNGPNENQLKQQQIPSKNYKTQLPSVVGHTASETLLGKVLAARELLGGSLINVAKLMVANSDSEIEKIDVHQLFIDVAGQLESEIKDSMRNPAANASLATARSVIAILDAVLSEQAGDQKATDIQQQMRKYIADVNYQNWIGNHALMEIEGELFAERMMLKWHSRPVFHLALMLFPGEEMLLADTLDSLGAQMYPDWKLTVVAEFPAPDPLWIEMDALNWIQLDQEEDPYEKLNSLFNEFPADWVAYITPGTILEPQALVQFGDYINIRPKWKFIYSDEDMITADGKRSDPKFKPDFNLDFLRSKPYIGTFCLIHKDAFFEIGGIQAYVSAENYDLAFRIVDRFSADSIGHISDVLFHISVESLRSYNSDIGKEVVTHHLERNNILAHVNEGYVSGTHRVVYLHDHQPKVSIIIPNKDKLEYLQPCIESLLEKTTYPDYEVIIIDNNSKNPDTLDYYKQLITESSGKIRVIEYPHDFNFSAMCNLGSDNAQGEFLLFLNNDTEVVQGEWLDRMMLHAQREEVGVVGARLVYPETGRIQHAGVILGLLGAADHPFIGTELNDPSYMDRTLIDQNYSAVTAGCMLVKHDIYDSVDKMDENKFAVSYNDVDLCLKISNAGYNIVWTPFATLVHHGSVTQNSETKTHGNTIKASDRFNKEKSNLISKWGTQLALDPAYNPNLSLAHQDFRVEVNMPRNWDVNFHDRLRILGIPLPGASGDYRVIEPFHALSSAGLAQCEYYRIGEAISRSVNTAELLRLQPDVTIVQAAVDDVQMVILEDLKQFSPDVLRIFVLDDLITKVPEKNSKYRIIKQGFRDVQSRLRKALSHSQRLIVTTQPLADYCVELIDDIRIVPNRLSREKWCNLISRRGQSDKPRVGWVGAAQHDGDLELIYDVVKATANEFDWIFMGMCPDPLKPYIRESHEFVDISEYPEKMASLNLDIAVAPLEINTFNEAKSNLRLLEYGVLGWPVVCTDIYPYRTADAPVKRVENRAQDWIDALREYGNNPELRKVAGDELRDWVVKHYILEDHLDELYDAFSRDPKGSINVLQRQSA